MNEENGRVECRLRPVLWLGIVVIGVMGFGLASLPFLPDGQGNPPDIHRNPVAPFVWSATFTLLSLGCVVAFALYVLRARIIADENGLRWRDIRKELFARWDEVTDFYDSPLSSTRTHGRVETVAGKLSLEDFTNQEKLRAYIQSHATNAASREWKVKDPQRTKEIESWPQEFGYNVFWNNVLRLSVLAFLLCFCGLAIWQMWATLFVEPISFQLRILGVVAALFVGAIPVLLFVAHFIMWKNVRKRFGERIVITPQNIVFIDRTRQVEARWDEVTNYYIERTGGFAGANYVVETTRGNWSFSNDISRFLVLKQLIIEYSIGVESSTWESRIDIDKISAKDACWEENQKVVGRNIYHFRSNTNRAMLWFFWAIGLRPLIHIFFPTSFSNAQPNLVSLWIFLFIGVCFASWMTFLYKHDYVATDENGISHRTPFGTKFIAWNDIERFGKSDFGFSVIVGKKTRIQFCNVIVKEEQLRNEIAQSSTRSRTREWHNL